MSYRTKNEAAASALTATRPTAFVGRKWVRWTQRMKAEFLDALAQTCNIKQSAAAIGVDPVSVYGLRRRDPAFLEEWELALVQGYQLLETMLLEHLLAGGSETGTITRPEGGAIEVEVIMRALTLHRASVAGIGAGGGFGRDRSPGGPRLQRASDADTDAAILKKIAAIEKRRKA